MQAGQLQKHLLHYGVAAGTQQVSVVAIHLESAVVMLQGLRKSRWLVTHISAVAIKQEDCSFRSIAEHVREAEGSHEEQSSAQRIYTIVHLSMDNAKSSWAVPLLAARK